LGFFFGTAWHCRDAPAGAGGAWGDVNEGKTPDFSGCPIPPPQKFFAELFFKKATTPRPQAHRQFRTNSAFRAYTDNRAYTLALMKGWNFL